MNQLFTTAGPYNVIYADPPYQFQNKNTGGSMISGAANKYPVMSSKDIAALSVQNISADDCILFMWWVGSQPDEAKEIMKAWGFRLVTMTGFIWVKETTHGKLDFGMGTWTRACAECCLIAVRGRPKRASASIRSVYIEDSDLIEIIIRTKKEEHSKKPDIFRRFIETLCGDVPRVELFARQQTPGWAVFGNEVENSIKL